jgi:hypothetical protein
VKRLVGAVALAASIAGLLEFVLSTSPDFSYLQTISVDPTKPYGFRFVFLNNGHSSAHSVMYACDTHAKFDFRLAPPESPPDGHTIFYAKHFESNIFRHAAFEVAPSEDVSVSCHEDIPADTVTGADLAIVIRYRPSWVVWRVSHAFRFKLLVSKDRSFQWVPEAMQSQNEKSDNPDPLYPEPDSN